MVPKTMTPSMKSFLEELVLLKTGAARPLSKEELKRLGKNVAAFSLGAGLGGGAGYAVRKKLLPKLLPHLNAKSRTALGVGGGVLTGLLSAGAMKHHMRTLDDKS